MELPDVRRTEGFYNGYSNELEKAASIKTAGLIQAFLIRKLKGGVKSEDRALKKKRIKSKRFNIGSSHRVKFKKFKHKDLFAAKSL